MLEGKNIVLIGGTAGIGLSAAQAIIHSGGRVVSVGLDEASCAEADKAFGNSGIALRGDAREEGLAEQALERCAQAFGPPDGLYHVAGGSGRRWGDGPLHACSMEAWTKTFQLNLDAMMLSNRAAIRYWLENGRPGSLLNLGSVVSFSPSSLHFATHAYAAAKAAAIGLTRSLASFYAPNNIRVNLLAPALTRTPMAGRATSDEQIMAYIKEKQVLDGGRAGLPADLDGAALYFLSDQSRFTTGQVLAVDGGWSLREGCQAIPEENN